MATATAKTAKTALAKTAIAKASESIKQKAQAAPVAATVEKPESAVDCAKRLFKENIELRKTHGDAYFRRTVFEGVAKATGVTHGSSCSAYNAAKKYWAEHEPELVVGLGRPEGANNGGAKPQTYYVIANEDGVQMSDPMSKAKATAKMNELVAGGSTIKMQILLAPEQEAATA